MESSPYILSSPLGPLRIFIHKNHVVGLEFVHSNALRKSERRAKSSSSIAVRVPQHNPLTAVCKIISGPSEIPQCLRSLSNQLSEYFQGRRTQFDVPLLAEGTDFQRKVWKELQEIPFGTRISYQQQATQMGIRSSVRAVANANGRNPIPILIPCHRVVATGGALGGYSGGINIKSFLLDHEAYYGLENTKNLVTSTFGNRPAEKVMEL